MHCRDISLIYYRRGGKNVTARISVMHRLPKLLEDSTFNSADQNQSCKMKLCKLSKRIKNPKKTESNSTELFFFYRIN